MQQSRHFRHFCEGRAFHLWTDHKPLLTALSRVSAPIFRHDSSTTWLSKFHVQMLYLPGLKNVVADFLPPPPPPKPSGTVTTTAAADPVDFDAMATKQNRCAETQRLPGRSSLKLAFQHQKE
jgi:hypothetical protein